MKTLYPPIKANKTEYLKVSALHELYVEESGNPLGLPVVFLHGGPGGGVEESYRSFFNPEKYRIILFDQRGCGKSRPFSELSENTTWDLVADIEKIREHFKIEKWVVFGGSWGSTLALAYATKHVERVHSLVLRGIFLLREKEIKWFYQHGTSELFPDLWESYRDFIPENERHDFVAAYYKRLTSHDPAVRKRAAKIWSTWEGATSKLLIDPKSYDRFGDDQFADAFARIECHYFMNKGFFESDDYLLKNATILKDIPTYIVQGRYDVVCPPVSAWELKKKMPHAHLEFSDQSGHSAMEKQNIDALVRFTDKIVGL